MPRGTSLSAQEQRFILGMHECSAKISEIADKLGRHRNCISIFSKNPGEYGTAPRSGRKPKIDERCKRMIRRLAVEDSMSSGQIRAHLGLQVTRNRIVQILNENRFIEYTSMVPKPKLLERHIKARLELPISTVSGQKSGAMSSLAVKKNLIWMAPITPRNIGVIRATNVGPATSEVWWRYLDGMGCILLQRKDPHLHNINADECCHVRSPFGQ